MKTKDRKTMDNSDTVIVLNAHDTTSDPKKYGYNSWREYWEANGHSRNELKHHRKEVILDNTGRNTFVEVFQCLACEIFFQWDGDQPDCFDGCHVYIKGENEDEQYIFPFCHTCNHCDIEVEVSRNMLVKAPKEEIRDK